MLLLLQLCGDTAQGCNTLTKGEHIALQTAIIGDTGLDAGGTQM